MSRRVLTAILSLVLCAFAVPTVASAATPKVEVKIDRKSQKMDVYVQGQLKHSWAVSTGRKGFKTPKGKYSPTWMTKMWHSRQWQMAPMPHSIFFKDGYAIHGTTETRNLGRPASHGCVRLAPKNAAKLFALVKTHGEKKTRIVVS
jgi:lipoprotein-anchoring transpeptidase ErfK/SrfK